MSTTRAGWLRRMRTVTTRREAAEAAWLDTIRAARAAGVPVAELAQAAGVSAGRVSQIAPHATRSERESEPAPATRAVVDARAVTVPATLVSERASTHAATHYGARVTEFVSRADSPGRLLSLLRPDTVRVYVCGPAPEAGGASAKAERVRSWFLTPARGWSVAAAGHYLADVDVPVGRWTEDGTGRTVEVHMASSWTGDTSAGLPATQEAFGRVAGAIAAGFDGAPLLATPATTGRDLWRRTIPRGRAWPVLSAELRELIRATSGQGRIERAADQPWAGSGTVPAFTYLDGVLMYAGLTWGMPAGAPTWHRALGRLEPYGYGAEVERLMRGRGRWRITATVPADWRHVGLLPATAEAGGWAYPAEPGRTFTTWADGAEAWHALTRGWSITVHEGFTFPEGKPLDTWTRKLLDAWRALDTGDEAGRLARRMIRSLLLFTIGAFAAGSHKVTRTWPADDAEHAPIPAGIAPRIAGELLVWDELHAPTDWSEDLAHPEYAATVWARARVRLLDGPGAVPGERTGALHLPASSVVGFATDALYLAEPAGWAEGSEPGRFRTKGRIAEPRPWPVSWAELYALRDEAEA